MLQAVRIAGPLDDSGPGREAVHLDVIWCHDAGLDGDKQRGA